MSSSSFDSGVPPGFEALGLSPFLLRALSALGYEEPTPIQREAVPLLLAGRDVLGQAATGTGKTAAFALPMLQRLTVGQCGMFEASALVLVPTRELAVQVAEAVHSYGKELGVSVLPIYGGQDIGQQLRRLKRGIDVVVATPGRALDHLRRKSLKLDKVGMVVLDEADEMLDMGFAEDLEAILGGLPEDRQTALFSATLPPRIAAIAERHLKKPARLRISKEKVSPGSMPKVRQTAYIVPAGQKSTALGRILDLEAPRSAIVFCRTRMEVDELTSTLMGLGFRAEALHGGMTQDQRERVMKGFKAGKSELLVATDVAARGLHIEKLSHVVNFDLPTNAEAYVHRIGRTGRANQEGVAISLVDPRESRMLRNIEKLTGQRIVVATLPTVADLRARKLELLQASLREVLMAGDLDHFRVVVEGLAAEFELLDIAAAAVKLAQSASSEGEDEVEVEVEPAPPPPRPAPRFERSRPATPAQAPRDAAPRRSAPRFPKSEPAAPRRSARGGLSSRKPRGNEAATDKMAARRSLLLDKLQHDEDQHRARLCCGRCGTVRAQVTRVDSD